MNQEVVLSKIEKMIFVIRGQKVMFDRDLAELYGVETKRLNEQVKRNLERFPEDFMFQLTHQEFDAFQVTHPHYAPQKYRPNVFTENGVAMLSSVLNSKQAIQVNISIMRIFTKLRSFLLFEQGLNDRIDTLEKTTAELFQHVFKRLDGLDELIAPKLAPNRRKIGLNNDE